MLKPQSPQNPIVLINSGFSHQLFVEMLLSCVIQITVEILFAGNVKDLQVEENISQTKTKLISFYFNENQLLLTVVFYHFFTQSQIEPFQRTQEKHSHEPFLINRKRWRGDGSLAKTMRAIFRCCFFLRFVLLVRAFTATFLKTLRKGQRREKGFIGEPFLSFNAFHNCLEISFFSLDFNTFRRIGQRREDSR